MKYETKGYTEIIKIVEASINGDIVKSKKYIERFIIKYPESDLSTPFKHLLNGESNPSGLGHGDITGG